MSVGRTVDDCSHVRVFLIDQSSRGHCVHLHTWGYFLDVGHYVEKMDFESIGHVLEEIASQLDRNHFRRTEDGIETSEVGGGDGESEGRGVEVGASDWYGRVDQLAVVRVDGGGVPVHSYKDVRVSGKGDVELEGDEVDGGRVLSVGEELYVSNRVEAVSVKKKQAED